MASIYKGSPCPRGHDGLRYKQSNMCVHCVALNPGTSLTHYLEKAADEYLAKRNSLIEKGAVLNGKAAGDAIKAAGGVFGFYDGSPSPEAFKWLCVRCCRVCGHLIHPNAVIRRKRGSPWPLAPFFGDYALHHKNTPLSIDNLQQIEAQYLEQYF